MARNWLIALIAALTLSVTARPIAAHPDLQSIRSDVVSGWIVEVEGEARSRTLRISDVVPRSDGVWDLRAVYGWSDVKSQSIVRAELATRQDAYVMTIVTPVNSVITAHGGANGVLTGTIQFRSAQVKPVRLVRVSDAEFDRHRSERIARAANHGIVPPGPDVPPACAAFVGGWVGPWTTCTVVGAERWLWVVEVDAACTAKVSTGPNGYRGPFTRGTIRNGVLLTPCDDGQDCKYERVGEKLWGSWQGLASGCGYRWSGEMSRVPPAAAK
jgi:hypothetical protein